MNLLELIATGISLGSIYAVLALGFVVVYKATGAFNFAQGGVLLVGGLLVARLHDSLGFVGAVAAGVCLTAVFAVAVYWLVVSRISGAHAVIPIAIVLLGVDLITTTEVRRNIGTAEALSLGAPWGSESLELLGLSLPVARWLAIATAALVIGAFALLFKYSEWGVAMRAGSADPETAALMGVRLRRIAFSAWAIGGALATVAAVFLTSFPSPGLTADLGSVALRALPAAMLGGLDSPKGAVVGGMAIGLAEALVIGYQSDLSFLGGGLSAVAPYVVLIAVLLWRPSGIFGSKEVARV